MTMKYKLCLLVAAFAAASLNASAADAAATYKKMCGACHGTDGKGATKMGKKLKVEDLTTKSLSEAKILEAIKDGVKEGGKVRMKPVSKLSDADAKAVAAYVKGLQK